MAKPRVFISSTYYDLKTLRTDLEHFVRDQGYDPVLFERGQVAYGSESPLEEYCHREIENCDILVSIIGGKIGTNSNRGHYSISQIELKTAIESGKQVYIFIEKDVYNEYRTYSHNREAVVEWQSVNDKRIFQFITEVYELPYNNMIMSFDTSHDIAILLRELWAGLFQRLLLANASQPSFALVGELRQSLETSRKLAEILAAERNRGDSIVEDILLTSHPIFGEIRQKMGIPYRVFFTNKQELDAWMKARTFKPETMLEVDDDYFEWENNTLQSGKMVGRVQIRKSLFEEDLRLKIISVDNLQKSSVKYTIYEKVKSIDPADDDIPF